MLAPDVLHRSPESTKLLMAQALRHRRAREQNHVAHVVVVAKLSRLYSRLPPPSASQLQVKSRKTFRTFLSIFIFLYY